MSPAAPGSPAWKNHLYFGDNLEILRQHLPSESVDLVYIDPPFNSSANYNVLFREESGEGSHAQITAFEDTWHWGPEAAGAFHEVVTGEHRKLADLVQAIRTFLGQNAMMAYLTMVAVRLVELHRVLKSTGSMYIHCDPTASHYLKLLMDAAFGTANFRSEVIWKRTGAHGSAKRYGPVHDTILFYSKTERYLWTFPKAPHDPAYLASHFTFRDPDGRVFQPITLTGSGIRRGESGLPWGNYDPTAKGRHWALPGAVLAQLEITGETVQDRLDALDRAGLIYWPAKVDGIPRLKAYADELEGVALDSVWTDIAPLNSQAKERLGYPTQKPEVLLERIIRTSSNEGDVVLDAFCGCGTAIAVAERLKRRWIGIDVTHLAIALMKHRLAAAFGGDLTPYKVIGEPEDLESARALALENRHQFEWWAVGLVAGRPAQDKKKGADRGVDGIVLFYDDDSGTPKRALVSAKSGHVSVPMIRDLVGVLEREKAPIGILVTLEEPTRPMLSEAATAGFYEPKFMPGHRFPRVQILTIAELLRGKQAEHPRLGIGTFKRAPRQKGGAGAQQGLLL